LDAVRVSDPSGAILAIQWQGRDEVGGEGRGRSAGGVRGPTGTITMVPHTEGIAMRTTFMLVVAAGFALAAAVGVALAAEEHVGPHGGPAAEWGAEEYHLEVVPDAKAGTVA